MVEATSGRVGFMYCSLKDPRGGGGGEYSPFSSFYYTWFDNAEFPQTLQQLFSQGAYRFLKINLRPFLRHFKTNFSEIQYLYARQVANRLWEIGHRQQLERLDD